MPEPLNAKGKPFAWSFSAMNSFLQCPRRYGAEKFYCNIPFVQNKAAKDGDTTHKALERRLKPQKTPLPAYLQEYEKYVLPIEAKEAEGFDLSVEGEITLDENFNQCGWFDDQAWARAKMDVRLKKGNVAAILDWKTGKVKDDPRQLRVMAAIESVLSPEVDLFKCRFIWLKTGEITGEDLTRADADEAWKDTLHILGEMKECWRTEEFIARTSGLCRKHCPVMDCPHNGLS